LIYCRTFETGRESRDYWLTEWVPLIGPLSNRQFRHSLASLGTEQPSVRPAAAVGGAGLDDRGHCPGRFTTVTVRTSGIPQQSIWPSIVSDDAAALYRWLLALGFSEDLIIPGERDGAIHHCQLDWPEGGRVMLSSTGERPTPCQPGTSSLHVVTADPDAVMIRAHALKATVVHELTNHTDYPSRDFTIADLDGNHWTFATFAG
jgi:uncharacterized glyoxalase superfamily protein PhnB